MTRRIPAALTLALLLGAACGAHAAELRTRNYCDGPGARCLDIDSAEPGPELAKLTWCCPYDEGPCVLVVGQSACDPVSEYAVICDWGRSMPDGSIECYEDQ